MAIDPNRYIWFNILREEGLMHHFAGSIYAHLIALDSTLNDSTTTDNQRKELFHKYLSYLIPDHYLQKSFRQPIGYIYDENLGADAKVIETLHEWLQNKACNIENVVIVFTHTQGLKEWYEKFCEVKGEKGFHIVEALWTSSIYWMACHLDTIRPWPQDHFDKKLSSYFTYYGGTRSDLETDMLAGWALTQQHRGHVDFMGGFRSDKQTLRNYMEKMSSFMDQKSVDAVMDLTDTTFNQQHNEGQRFDRFDYTGVQWNNDQKAFAQLIRETSNNTPWAIVTEKTMRSLLHFQVPLPVQYKMHKHLTEQGFELFDCVDYNYLNNTKLWERVQGACQQIENLANNYSLRDLEEYIITNNDKFMHNQQLISSGHLFEQARTKLITELKAIFE